MSGEPEECPLCNAHPSFEEVWDGAWQCQNCGTVIDVDGKILEEGEEPSPDTEEALFDDELDEDEY
jgi:ribosomal protein L37AE/L43A